MHVRIDGDTVGAYQLKLRGVALDQFDGTNWSSTRDKLRLTRGPDGFFNLRLHEPQPPKGLLLHYRVAMEPLLSDVFFLLATPSRLEGNYRAVALDRENDVFNLDNEHPVSVYQAESVPRAPVLRGSSVAQVFLPPDIESSYLRLPETDPRVKALAEQIARPGAGALNQASAIENYLRMHYRYTLQLPAKTPRDPIADFLFVRREGHCEYFASTMAVMLRVVGIPSRVVNGFSGGEFNDLTSQYVIRESDAHSWVEAFIPGQGWMEFDPTPPAGAHPQTRWGRLLLYIDAINSFWRDWVINYDLGHQLRLTQDAGRGSRELVGRAQSWTLARYDRALAWARRVQHRVGVSAGKWALRAFVVLALLLLLANIPRLIVFGRRIALARRPERAPQMAASIWYRKMLRAAARRGWEKAPSQTPDEFACGIQDERLRKQVSNFTESYEKARFGGSAEEASRLSEMYSELKSGR